ncbi:PLP-dependent aminotransferase family protein [Thermopolyspora sp. NPDC052614]|uniref:MocR-like pyridoxine biosynthesis transcription factor PdxR n=1 Tax=Thermopolyspora sp. NPDC052614 TaxID=3155682 RepID=UPI00341A8018
MVDLHLPIDRAKGGLAAQVSRALRDSIRSGRLRPGEQLPATRELARDLRLSRGVIVEAYEQLVAEGFLVSRVGAGTRVAETVAGARGGEDDDGADASGLDGGHSGAEGRATTYYGYRPTSPDLSMFPRQRWLAALRHVLTTVPHDALDYGDPGGAPELREELAAYLRRVRAADASATNLVIVSGVAQALSLTVRALAGEGRVRLAVEDPTTPRPLPLLRSAGAELVPVPVDEEGMDAGALRRSGAEAVLLTPAHNYPTGVVLSPRRRAEIAAWAAETGATVLEDDYDAEFRFDRDPVGCLQGLAPDRVVLAGSVSKSLAPGLRLGWLVAPAPIAEAVRNAREAQDLGSPVIDQYALAHFVATGAYDRHLRRMRREYRTRRDALVRALAEHLPQVRVPGVAAGLHLYAELPEGWDERKIADIACAAGLTAEPVAPTRHVPGPPAVVIGFARLPAHRIAEAVHDLGRNLGPDVLT